MKNLVATIFQLENSRTEADFIQVLDTLIEWLNDSTQARLKADIERWLDHLVLPKRLPNTTLTQFITLQEMKTMLSESIDDWTTQLKVEGQADLLVRLLEDKFGSLDPDISATIHRLDDDSLFEYVKRSLTAQTLGEIIGH